jgi:hypothetical protein
VLSCGDIIHISGANTKSQGKAGDENKITGIHSLSCGDPGAAIILKVTMEEPLPVPLVHSFFYGILY